MWQKWGLFLCHLEDEAVSQHTPVVHVLRFPHRSQGKWGKDMQFPVFPWT